MLRAVSRPLVRLAERYLPTAFVFAVVLTAVVAVGALLATDSGPVEVVRAPASSCGTWGTRAPVRWPPPPPAPSSRRPWGAPSP